jgi:hypothetical protein
MNLSVAQTVARQERQITEETIQTVDLLPGKCTTQFVPSVAKHVKFLLNLAMVAPFIAEIASNFS